MKRFISAVLVISVIGITSTNAAEQMAIWDFGGSSAYYTELSTAEYVVGTPTLSLSGGEIDLNGKNGVAYVDISGASHIAGQPGAWGSVKVDGPDAEWDVTINTTGRENMSVRSDYKTWDSTTTTFDLDYRLSETAEWVAILDDQTITADSTFHAFAYSLAGIYTIENQSLVQFRFNDLDKNGNGKFAFDNLKFAGPQILEPATAMPARHRRFEPSSKVHK
jgi:hypothetical protein